MKDITSREDVELLVRSFYTKVRKNETLGYIFDDVIKIDWEHHIPILVDFWETTLLDTNSYQRNAMAEHFKVNQKIKLEPLPSPGLFAQILPLCCSIITLAT